MTSPATCDLSGFVLQLLEPHLHLWLQHGCAAAFMTLISSSSSFHHASLTCLLSLA